MALSYLDFNSFPSQEQKSASIADLAAIVGASALSSSKLAQKTTLLEEKLIALDTLALIGKTELKNSVFFC